MDFEGTDLPVVTWTRYLMQSPPADLPDGSPFKVTQSWSSEPDDEYMLILLRDDQRNNNIVLLHHGDGGFNGKVSGEIAYLDMSIRKAFEMATQTFFAAKADGSLPIARLTH
jgi:hypothetical protein